MTDSDDAIPDVGAGSRRQSHQRDAAKDQASDKVRAPSSQANGHTATEAVGENGEWWSERSLNGLCHEIRIVVTTPRGWRGR